MSWKKRDDLSEFGDRLRRLMADKSLHEVATAFYSSGTGRREQKIKVNVDQEEHYYNNDGVTITFKYEFDRGPGYEFYQDTE